MSGSDFLDDSDNRNSIDHDPQSVTPLVKVQNKEDSKVIIQSDYDSHKEEQKHEHFALKQEDEKQPEDQSYFALKRSEDYLHINVRILNAICLC